MGEAEGIARLAWEDCLLLSMADRTKILVHFRRLSGVFEHAIRNGPDGTLEGKHGAEHPAFVHYSCAFYLIGVLAYLEGNNGSYSWNLAGSGHADFDQFIATRAEYAGKNISKASLDALACIRNAVAHNDGDLSLNHNARCLGLVTGVNLPGVVMTGATVTLQPEFFDFVRLAGYAVRHFHGET